MKMPPAQAQLFEVVRPFSLPVTPAFRKVYLNGIGALVAAGAEMGIAVVPGKLSDVHVRLLGETTLRTALNNAIDTVPVAQIRHDIARRLPASSRKPVSPPITGIFIRNIQPSSEYGAAISLVVNHLILRAENDACCRVVQEHTKSRIPRWPRFHAKIADASRWVTEEEREHLKQALLEPLENQRFPLQEVAFDPE